MGHGSGKSCGDEAVTIVKTVYELKTLKEVIML